MSYLSTPTGIHRVKREPYDDSEIFNSVEEIINYLDIYGAYYNGQKIRLCMNGFVLDFTLQNGYAIPILPNGQELEYYKVYNESTEEYDYYIQIFYFNPNLLKKDFINDSNLLNSINDFSNHYNFNNQIYENSNILFNRLIETDFLYLNDPNKFSILNLLPLFNQTKYQKPKDNNPIDKTETFIAKCSNLVTQNGNECNILVKFDQIFEILVAENPDSQILAVNTSREGSGHLISYHQRRNNDSILFDFFYLDDSNEEDDNNTTLFPIMLRSPIISVNGENTYYKFDSFSLYVKCNDYVKQGMGVEYNGV